MSWPFLNSRAGQRRDQVLAVDLGSRTTKAVYVQRRGAEFALCGYTVMDAPIYDRSLPADLLTDHLKTLSQALPVKTKYLVLTLGVNDAIVRPVELPRIPTDEMR
jgi:Tfp pilus assembly PilM family ATPase